MLEFAKTLLKNLAIDQLRKDEKFEKLLREAVPSYFKEVYEEVEKLMKQTISKNTIDEIDGQINGIKRWMRNHYMEKKNSNTSSRKELHDLLLPWVNENAVKMVSVLMHPQYAESALGVFVIGASLHLRMLQELASVDPSASSVENSTYIKIMVNYAKDYVQHAKKAI